LGPLLYLIFTADIPTRNDSVIATFADDTAIMASNENSQTAFQSLQTHLNQFEAWLSNWRIKVNETKSAQVTCTRQSFAESEDTRGCICTIYVVDLLMMGGLHSKHVEEFNLI
jgi:hypothetical protein